jgi:hypothetical protein
VVQHQHVQTAEVAGRVRDRLAGVPLLAQVAAEGEAAAAGPFHQLGGVPGVAVLAEVGDRDVRALLGERDRHRAADARVATGDQGALPVQQVAALVVAHLVARLGCHIRGASWVGLALCCGWLAHRLFPSRAVALPSRAVACVVRDAHAREGEGQT